MHETYDDRDACRLYLSTLERSMPHETWNNLREEERAAFRQLSLDADILPDHYPSKQLLGRTACKCGEIHPCSIRKFLTLPALFDRGNT